MGKYVQMQIDTSEQETNVGYRAFVDKFKPKLTTDDCYTPPLVYNAVRDWACAEYGINPDKIVRPFYPGGDYEHYDYPSDCVVLDNPPFSIVTKICEFYLDEGIDFFLFAPGLTVFAGRKVTMRMNHIICDANIVYDNGARVRTAFVTSFGGDEVARTAPDLRRAVDAAVMETRKAKIKTLPNYDYPDHAITAAAMQKLSKYGVDFRIKRNECCAISTLDSMRDSGKGMYGGGLLVCDETAKRRAAAERAAAERAAAEKKNVIVWGLSERELEIVRMLGESGT